MNRANAPSGHKSCVPTGTQSENTGGPIDRDVKVFVEANGCAQDYGEARLMADALTDRGHSVTVSEQEADAHVLVT